MNIRNENTNQEKKTQHENNNWPGYLMNLGMLLKNSVTFRSLAYASEIGEASKPIVSKRIVNIAYGISFAYVLLILDIKHMM